MSPSRREPRAITSLVDRVARTITERGMLKGGETVVVAVSGGPDSVAMLLALARLAPALDLTLHVAHLDHRWREGSDADAALVARLARRLGLPITSRALTSGRAREDEARRARLAFLDEVADGIGATAIATAHTRDDQAETVLMRILRGGGRRGLGGIPPVRDRFIRPLIDVARAEVEAFIRASRATVVRDPSNEDRRYLRSVIRHDVLPMLAGTIDASLPERLARVADVLRDEDRLLDALAEEAIPAEPHGAGVRLARATLLAAPVALQRRAIRRALGIAAPPAEQIERVRALAESGETGARAELGGGWVARVEYGWLVFGRETGIAHAPAAPVTLQVPGETELTAWGCTVRTWITGRRPRAWPDGRERCVVDADRVAFPLEVRRWRPGDRLRPLGMRHRKKVGDLFTDARVPRGERGNVPLVVGSDGAIVWVVGHRIDEGAKVTAATRRALWIVMEGDRRD